MITCRVVLANIDQNMAAARIRSDVAKVFSLSPDLIVFNEMTTPGHTEVRAQATRLGYRHRIPKGALSQVVLVWRTQWTAVGGEATRVTLGRKGLTPNRGRVRQLLTRPGSPPLALIGTHFPAKAFTHKNRATRAWLRTRWETLRRSYAAAIKRNANRGDGRVVIYAGDVNRPDNTWAKGQPFPGLTINARGYATATIPRTPPTFGSQRYDLVGVLSKTTRVTVASQRVVALNSDHHAVIVDLTW